MSAKAAAAHQRARGGGGGLGARGGGLVLRIVRLKARCLLQVPCRSLHLTISLQS